MRLGELEIEEAARQATGNWQTFDCFVWFRKQELHDSEHWAVIYTHHRDSGLIDESNAAVFMRTLERFAEGTDPDLVFETHSHWAVGEIHGFSVRIFRNGKITEAFRKYHELAEQVAEYPILDESDYSDREYDATLQNIDCVAWRLQKSFELPEGWEGQVYGWLSDHMDRELEDCDYQGGCPKEEAVQTAFAALGFEPRTAA